MLFRTAYILEKSVGIGSVIRCGDYLLSRRDTAVAATDSDEATPVDSSRLGISVAGAYEVAWSGIGAAAAISLAKHWREAHIHGFRDALVAELAEASPRRAGWRVI